MSKFEVGGLAAVVLLLASGCKPSSSNDATMPPLPAQAKVADRGPSSGASAPAVRVHWLGKKRIAADTNAAYVMRIWSLPESQKLETQTLEKLSQAPARWLGSPADTNTVTASTNAASALLRPLAEDLLQEESYWEVRRAPDRPQEIAFVIRLSDAQAGIWETNLAAALETLTGEHTLPASGGRRGWSLKGVRPSPGAAASELAAGGPLIEFARAGEWAVVGVSRATNTTVAELLGRLGRDHAPFPAPATNFWLEAAVDLARFASAFPPEWVPTNGLPRLELNVFGENLTVRSLGRLTFAQPLAFEIEPWNIPTNIIHDPLSSFTAIQGTGAWLAALPIWNRFLPGFAPDQVFFWAQGQLPLQNYLAIPDRDASNHVAQLTESLVQDGNTWIATNSLGQFQRQSNAVGVLWANMPFADPHLEVFKDGQTDLILAGLGAAAFTNRPMPAALWQQVVGNPKLVAYDWEMTGSRIEGWIYASQLARFLARKPEVPPQSVGIAWLKVLDGHLGNCGTAVTRLGPAQLGVVRGSSLGFSAPELNLFVDWLESPTFPQGLNTFVAPPPTRHRPPKTP